MTTVPQHLRARIIQSNIDRLQAYHDMLDDVLYERERWRPHRLRWPRRIQGQWYWPGQTVYRRHCIDSNGGYWQYGTVFDAIKDAR